MLTKCRTESLCVARNPPLLANFFENAPSRGQLCRACPASRAGPVPCGPLRRCRAHVHQEHGVELAAHLLQTLDVGAVRIIEKMPSVTTRTAFSLSFERMRSSLRRASATSRCDGRACAYRWRRAPLASGRRASSVEEDVGRWADESDNRAEARGPARGEEQDVLGAQVLCEREFETAREAGVALKEAGPRCAGRSRSGRG